MSDPIIRPATLADAPRAVEVLRASIAALCSIDHQNDPATLEQWLRNKTTVHFERWLNDPGNHTFVAELDGEVRGVGQVHESGELRLCYVHPGFERTGLGRALLGAAEQWSEAAGLSALRLKSSATARGFYERQGYVSAGEPVQASGGTLAYPYTKPLGYRLFFDLDGTLTDPAPGITACFVHAAEVLGHVAPAAAELRRFIGPPLRESLGELLNTRDPARIEEGVRVYRERFSTIGLFENAVYPGVSTLLAQLTADRFLLRLVTSKARIYAQRILEHFDLQQFFPLVYGAELSGERSNKVELIRDALSAEWVAPERACMIGDRSHDVLGAKAHGVVSLGVTWGYGTREELESAAADRIAETQDELLAAVRALRAEKLRLPERTRGSKPP